MTTKREFEIVESIKQGLDDMRLGRTIPHKQAMRRLRATIARAALKNSSLWRLRKAGARNP